MPRTALGQVLVLWQLGRAGRPYPRGRASPRARVCVRVLSQGGTSPSTAAPSVSYRTSVRRVLCPL